MQRAYFSADARSFLQADPESILGALAARLPFPMEPSQRAAWQAEIIHLKLLSQAIPEAHIFLEFAIPRMGRRADAVVVAGGIVFVLEYKVGESSRQTHAVEQVHGYALDLKYFHETSHRVPVVPVLIATHAPPQSVGLGLAAPDGVYSPMFLSAGDVVPALRQMIAVNAGLPLDAVQWAEGDYRPTPTIIEAAQALFRGHDVAEISRSEAGAENLTLTALSIDRIIEDAHATGGKALCFVTGVPGAGKTLAGLNIACSRMERQTGEDATFLSGNAPLVDVLREALKRDLKRRKQAPDPGDPEARHVLSRSPDKFVQNVHHFRDEYLDAARIPSEHVVVFDEAQRAWNRQETARFMQTKRGQADFGMSEPEFLLSVMDRHPDWCVVVCLIGEGQETNRGEAGVAEWISALSSERMRSWSLYASPHLAGADSVLDKGLKWLLQQRAGALDTALHLAVSVRSFRAETVSAYVAALLSGDAASARNQLPEPARYPIWRTRSLAAARAWLRDQRRAGERTGLLASSNALRLKPEGIFVKAGVDVCNWFLNGADDIRASTMLEDAATEFDVQGLELDWTCVCWDLNWRRGETGWEARDFRGTKWQAIHGAASDALGRADYVKNAYRVLLTRARQGMVIFVPRGDPDDATRPPKDYDAIDQWLAACGVPALCPSGTPS